MATNTSGTVHLSDSDDSDYQYEVQNLAQQVIHFVDNNNVTSSDNESLNNYSSDNESVDSENGQNGNGNCMQISISNYEWDTDMKQILKWDGNGYFIWTLGQVLDLSWEKKCWSWIEKRMNLITSLKLCLRLKCRTILPMKLTNMQKQGWHKDISKNKYLLFHIFNMLYDIHHIFNMLPVSWFHDSLNVSG